MHGELLKARCQYCETVQAWRRDLTIATPAPNAAGPAPCDRTSSGSAKCRFTLADIDHALRNADLFVAIGTSGAVYPAAGFVAEARAMACRTAK